MTAENVPRALTADASQPAPAFAASANAYEAAEREKFERWAKANTPLKFDRDLASYFSGTTQFAWMAWIERAVQADAAGALNGAPGATDAERAAWLADKIAAGGDYAKEAAHMLRRWPAPGAAACPESGKHCRPVDGECQTCGAVGVKGRAMHLDCTAPDCDCEPGIECAARGASRGVAMPWKPPPYPATPTEREALAKRRAALGVAIPLKGQTE